MPRCLFSTAVAVWMLAGCGTTAAAQNWQRSALVGAVRDGSGTALPGVKVTISGTLLGGPRAVETDEQGRYRFSGLLPGTYRLSAQHAGFAPARTPELPLPVETTYTVDIILTLAVGAEHVTVLGERPVIDTKTTGSSSVFPAEQLQRLPTGRSLPAVLNLAPGITENVAFGGTQSSSNRIAIDGVGLNAAYLGEQWVRPHFNWLHEVQVVAVGAPADHGGFTGAVANGVLRSGSNRFSVLGDYLTVRPSWSGDNTGSLPAGTLPPRPRTILHWRDAAAQAGGPIKRDRAWLFAGFSYVDHEYRNFSYSGPDATRDGILTWLVKMDAAPSDTIQTQAFFLRDTSHLTGLELSPRRPTLESTSDIRQRKGAWNGRVTWRPSAATAVEFRTGGHLGTNSREPHPPGMRSGPSTVVDEDTGIMSGNTPLYVWTDSEAITATGTMTHYAVTRVGRHEFQAGLEASRANGIEESGYTGGGVYHYSGASLVYADLWQGDSVRTRNSRMSLHAQDRWMFSRVTIEPGLRLDFYRGSVPGQSDVFRTRPIGPRLGVAWDITEAHRTVVRGHYGRYHDMQFGYLYAFADRAARNPIIGAHFHPDGSMVEDYRIDPDQTSVVDSSLKQPHVDQFAAGLERQIGDDTSVRLQYVHRRYGNFLGYVDPRIGEWRPFTTQDPGEDGIMGTADDGGVLTGYQPYEGPRTLALTNPHDAWRHYDAIQIVARKRLANRWQMEASFTASRSEGTVGNEANTNAAWATLSPGGIGADGQARGDALRPPTYDSHEGKALASYDAPWLGGVRVGAVYRWRSGTRWHRLVRVRQPILTNIPGEPPNSRRTPAVYSLDLRVEKTFPFARSTARIGLYLDVFNVTNVGRALAFTRMSGPAFGTPGGWTEPRTAQLGARIAF